MSGAWNTPTTETREKRYMPRSIPLSEHEFDAQPFAPFWKSKAHDNWELLKEKLGQPLAYAFRDALPDEFYDVYSPQQQAKSFERALRAVNELPLGTAPTVEFLLDHYQYKKGA